MNSFLHFNNCFQALFHFSHLKVSFFSLVAASIIIFLLATKLGICVQNMLFKEITFAFILGRVRKREQNGEREEQVFAGSTIKHASNSSGTIC